MTDLLDRVQQEIHQRLEELRPGVAEYERLLQAYQTLTDQETRASRHRANSGNAPVTARGRSTDVPPPARERAPRGANRNAVLEALRDRPGATAGDLSAASGVRGPAMSKVLRALAKAKEIEKHDLPGGRPGYRLRKTK